MEANCPSFHRWRLAEFTPPPFHWLAQRSQCTGAAVCWCLEIARKFYSPSAKPLPREWFQRNATKKRAAASDVARIQEQRTGSGGRVLGRATGQTWDVPRSSGRCPFH